MVFMHLLHGKIAEIVETNFMTYNKLIFKVKYRFFTFGNSSYNKPLSIRNLVYNSNIFIDYVSFYVDEYINIGEIEEIKISDESTIRLDKMTGIEIVQGYLNNIKITQSSNKTYFNGSFTKYIKGNNVETITIRELIDFFDYLAKITKCDLSTAKISRMEFGCNIIVKEAAANYLHCFDTFWKKPFFCCLVIKDGLLETHTFDTKTGGIKFIIYNKTSEMKNEMPEIYKDKNIIRFEVKFKDAQTIKNKFGLNNLLMLSFPETHEKLKREFLKIWQSIPKKDIENTASFQYDKNVSLKQFNSLAAQRLKELLPDEYQRLLNNYKENGLLSDRNFREIKKIRHEYEKAYCTPETNTSLVNEMNELIHSALNIDY